MSTLLLTMLIVNCAPQKNEVDHQPLSVDANVPDVEHSPGPATVTSAPALTGTQQVTATRPTTASPTPSQPSAATPKPTIQHHPTATVAATPTHTAEAELANLETAGAGNVPAEKTADATGLAERGILVYQELYCGICHQLDAAGTTGMFGPTHNDFAQTAEQVLLDPTYTGKATTAEAYVRESILSPEIYIVEGYHHTSHHMPAYTNLSENDLDVLVQLLIQRK